MVGHAHTTFPLSSSDRLRSPLFWGNSGDFLILIEKKFPREPPVASGINFCFMVAHKLARRHTLACWSTDKLPRTSKGLMKQTAVDFYRNVMHSMCLRGWRRAGVV